MPSMAMEAPVSPSVALVSAPAVRRAGKAALCGEGADELFAGYRMHDEPEPFLRGFEERLRKLRGAAVGERTLATTTAQILRAFPRPRGSIPSRVRVPAPREDA